MKKNIILMIIMVILSNLPVSAQKIDKLLAKKKYEKALEYCSKLEIQAEKNKCYSKIGGSYFEDKNYKKAIDFYIKGKNMKGYESANEKLGDINFKTQKFDAAFNYYIQANNLVKIKSTAFELGNIEFNEGKYLEAIDFYEVAKRDDKLKLTYKKIADEAYRNKRFKKSITFYKKANDTINIIKAYKNVAIIYFDKGNYLQAVKYSELANDTSSIRKSKKQLGLQYINERKYSDAINCFKEINDTQNLKKAYHKYAEKQYSDNNYSQAIKYFRLSNDKRGIYKSYMAMADIAYASKQFKKALNYLDKCKKIYPNKTELLNKVEQYSNFITDARDGKTYTTVKIGNQWWMAENMAYYSSSLYSDYEKDEPCTNFRVTNYKKKYGYLYSLKVAKKVCPTGWHLPNFDEWHELERTIGIPESEMNEYERLRGDKVVGKVLSKNPLWKKAYGSDKITNSLGFSVLPAGYGWYKIDRNAGRLHRPYFIKEGDEARFWSSTEGEDTYINKALTIIFRTRGIDFDRSAKNMWHSVRCVKD